MDPYTSEVESLQKKISAKNYELSFLQSAKKKITCELDMIEQKMKRLGCSDPFYNEWILREPEKILENSKKRLKNAILEIIPHIFVICCGIGFVLLNTDQSLFQWLLQLEKLFTIVGCSWFGMDAIRTLMPAWKGYSDFKKIEKNMGKEKKSHFGQAKSKSVFFQLANLRKQKEELEKQDQFLCNGEIMLSNELEALNADLAYAQKERANKIVELLEKEKFLDRYLAGAAGTVETAETIDEGLTWQATYLKYQSPEMQSQLLEKGQTGFLRRQKPPIY